MRETLEKQKGLLVVLGLALLSAFLFYSYQRAGSNDPETLPLIRASEIPYKIKPENPGGMSLAHQDNALMQIIEDRRDWDRAQMREEEEAEAEPEEIATSEAKIEEDIEEQAPENPIQFEPVLKQLTAPKPQQAAQAQEKSTSKGTHFIQLGSFRSREEAQKGYAAFEQKYGRSVNQLGVRYQTAEIEGKGTFFRVQAGPASKSRADTLCGEIKTKGGACYVVGR